MAFRHGAVAHPGGGLRHGDILYEAFGTAFLGVVSLAVSVAEAGVLTASEGATPFQAAGVEAVAQVQGGSGVVVSGVVTAGVNASCSVLAESGTLVAAADGWTFVILEDPLADAGYRLTAIPDLEAGDVVWYGDISDSLVVGIDVTVETDGSITLSEDAVAALPVIFDAFVDDGARGSTAQQTLTSQTQVAAIGVASEAVAQSESGELVADDNQIVQSLGAASESAALAESGILIAATVGNTAAQGAVSASTVEAQLGGLIVAVVFDGIEAISDVESTPGLTVLGSQIHQAHVGVESNSQALAEPGGLVAAVSFTGAAALSGVESELGIGAFGFAVAGSASEAVVLGRSGSFIASSILDTSIIGATATFTNRLGKRASLTNVLSKKATIN
jgi:hypothetical protein